MTRDDRPMPTTADAQDELIVHHAEYKFMRTPIGGYYLDPQPPGALGGAILSMLIQLHMQLVDTKARAERAEAESYEGWSKLYEARGLPVVKEEG